MIIESLDLFIACRCNEQGSTDSCSAIGQCSCNDNWTGLKCDQCEIGWTGENCDQCATGWTGNNCGQCDTDSGYSGFPYCTSKQK